MSSTLRFTGEQRVDITQHAAMATVGHVRPSRWSWRLALGAVLDGAMEPSGQTHEIGPGVVGSISVARMWAVRTWFVSGSLGMSASRTTTGEAGMATARAHLTALDARAGVVAGRTFGIVSPYVLARAFGGPVWWRLDGADVSGSDTHHYQLGAGTSLATASGLSFTLDLALLGERGASLGVALELQ